MNVATEHLSYVMKGEAIVQGAFECESHLWLQLSLTTSSHDPPYQAVSLTVTPIRSAQFSWQCGGQMQERDGSIALQMQETAAQLWESARRRAPM